MPSRRDWRGNEYAAARITRVKPGRITDWMRSRAHFPQRARVMGASLVFQFMSFAAEGDVGYPACVLEFWTDSQDRSSTRSTGGLIAGAFLIVVGIFWAHAGAIFWYRRLRKHSN